MNVTITKIYQRTVHSYLAIFDVVATGTEDPNIFVVKKDSPSSSSAPTSSSSASSPDIFLDRDKVLISIASLEDLAVYVTTFPGYDQLYRSDNVAMIFTSESAMNLTREKVKEDIQINARSQTYTFPALQTVTYSDTDIVVT